MKYKIEQSTEDHCAHKITIEILLTDFDYRRLTLTQRNKLEFGLKAGSELLQEIHCHLLQMDHPPGQSIAR